MHCISDHAPDDEIALRSHFYRLKIGIMRYEPRRLPVRVYPELLERIFAIDIRYYIIAVLWREAAIDDYYIAVKYTSVAHRIAFDVGVECRFRMRRHLPCKVDAFACMVSGGRRKACMNGLCKLQSQLALFRIRYINQFSHSLSI